MLKRFFGLNRGRHASCAGHHYHVVTTGWRCCGCRDKVSSRKSEPTSTGEFRRPDAIVAATKAAQRELVLEQLGYRTALEDEQTLAINHSRLRLRPTSAMDVKPRNTSSHINV